MAKVARSFEMRRACDLQAAIALLTLLVGCGCSGHASAPAPVQAGMCWLMDVQPRGRPVFVAVAAETPDLLSCAADLDIAYLNEGAPVTGAYQGRFIFIGSAAIESAERLDLIRYPVFNVAQRADLDRQLRIVLAARAKSARKSGRDCLQRPSC